MIHYKYFPKIFYGEDAATNIMVRAKVRDMIKSSAIAYYPYLVRDGDKPEIIADKYYGSVDYTWLVFYANDIFDPIWDWPLDYKDFNSFLVSKYGTIQASHTTIHHYELTPKGLIIDATSYNDPLFGDDQKMIVSCHEYENRLNEDKRHVNIFDKKYRDQIVNEMKRLFNKAN